VGKSYFPNLNYDATFTTEHIQYYCTNVFYRLQAFQRYAICKIWPSGWFYIEILSWTSNLAFKIKFESSLTRFWPAWWLGWHGVASYSSVPIRLGDLISTVRSRSKGREQNLVLTAGGRRRRILRWRRRSDDDGRRCSDGPRARRRRQRGAAWARESTSGGSPGYGELGWPGAAAAGGGTWACSGERLRWPGGAIREGMWGKWKRRVRGIYGQARTPRWGWAGWGSPGSNAAGFRRGLGMTGGSRLSAWEGRERRRCGVPCRNWPGWAGSVWASPVRSVRFFIYLFFFSFFCFIS
jgi:hypothetical protein